MQNLTAGYPERKPTEKYDLAVIIVNFNGADTLNESVRSIRTNCGLNSYCIVIVDNGSTDDSINKLYSTDDTFLIRSEANIGFGRANNLAIEQVDASYYYLHNSDAYLRGASLDRAFDAIRADDRIGAIGLPLVFPDGKPQSHAYLRMTLHKKIIQCMGLSVIFKAMLGFGLRRLQNWTPVKRSRQNVTYIQGQSLREGSELLGDRLHDVDWVCGASLLLNGSALKEVGVFDPQFFMYYEDEDLCARLHAGEYRVCTLDVDPVVHDMGWSRSHKKKRVSLMRIASARCFINKWFAKQTMRRYVLLGLLRFRPSAW